MELEKLKTVRNKKNYTRLNKYKIFIETGFG